MVYRRTARRIARRAARRAFRRGVRRGRRGRRIYRRRRRFFRAAQQVVRSYNAHPDKKKITFEWQEHRTLPSIGVRLKEGSYNAAELARAGYNPGVIPVTGIWIHNISRDVMEHMHLSVDEPQYVDTFTQWLSFGFNPMAYWNNGTSSDPKEEPVAEDEDVGATRSLVPSRWKRDMYVAYYHSWVPDLKPEDIWDGWYEEYVQRMTNDGVLGDDLEHPLDPSYSTLWPRKTRERTPMRCLYRRKFRFVSGSSNRFQAIAKVPLPSRWEIKKRVQLEPNSSGVSSGIQLVSGYVYRIIILTSAKQDTSLMAIPKVNNGVADLVEWYPRFEPEGMNISQFIDFNCNTKMVQKPRLLSTADVHPEGLEARVKALEDTLTGKNKQSLFWNLGKLALSAIVGNVGSAAFQGLGILKNLTYTEETYEEVSTTIMEAFVDGGLRLADLFQTTTGDVTSYNEGDFGPRPDGSYVVPTSGSVMNYIDTNIMALDLSIDTLNREVTEMVREITSLDARVRKLEAGVAPSEAVDELVREYQALVQRANVIEGTVTNLSTTVEQQTAEVDTINGKIGDWPSPSAEHFSSIYTEVHDVTEQSKKLKSEIDAAFATAGVSTAAALAAIAGMAAFYATNKDKLADAAKIAEQLKPFLEHGDFNLGDYLTDMSDRITHYGEQLDEYTRHVETQLSLANRDIRSVSDRQILDNQNMNRRWKSIVQNLDDVNVQAEAQQAFLDKLASWFKRLVSDRVNEAGETVPVVTFEVDPNGFLGQLEAKILANSQNVQKTASDLEVVNQTLAQMNTWFHNIDDNFANVQDGVANGTDAAWNYRLGLTQSPTNLFTGLGQILTEYPKSVGMTDEEFKTYLNTVLDQPSSVLLDAASACFEFNNKRIAMCQSVAPTGALQFNSVSSDSISTAQEYLSIRDCLKYIVFIAAVAAGSEVGDGSIVEVSSRMGVPSGVLLQQVVS